VEKDNITVTQEYNKLNLKQEQHLTRQNVQETRVYSSHRYCYVDKTDNVDSSAPISSHYYAA
jgi:hypothetical protein